MSRGLETRRRILDGALELARTAGLEQLTIGTLASSLDLSKSGLFAHFRSKENLQLEVLDAAAARFVSEVVGPAMKAPRGEPRVIALFEQWCRWAERSGGCIFVAATAELDDKPGVVRDRLVELQQAWLQTLARAARLAVEEGHFRAGTDVEQVAFEFYALLLATHHHTRLLRDPHALKRAKTAFDHLLSRCRSGSGSRTVS